MMWLLNLLNPLGGIASKLADAYAAKQAAATDQDRIEADITIKQLEARQAVLVAEQGSWMTRWVRPVIAAPFAIYLWKLIIWDKVLGWGATDNLSPELWNLMTVIIGAYFITRPFGRR